MLTAKLTFHDSPSCDTSRYLASIKIEHDIASFGLGDQFLLEISRGASEDMEDFRSIAKYMAYGIYMDSDEFNLMGGFDIITQTDNVDITELVTSGEEQFFFDPGQAVIDGTESLIVRITYTINSVTDSSEFALGYMPIEIMPLSGKRRMNMTWMPQALRGEHSSNKYNHQLRSVEEDIRLLLGQESVSLDLNYLSILKLDHYMKMIRM